jgi:uncharacterized membrane protein YedE/YeeE
MNSYWSSLAVETSPGLALALVAFLAALPPYGVLRQRGRGRARSAVAYLLGLAAGLASTIVLTVLLKRFVDPAAIVGAGLLAAFFAPFVGMVRAKWERPRRPARNPVMVRDFSG